ncbi:MAG: cobyrinate a,c-diamide synthase, partial [Pseudomonadota bacterium]
MSWTGRREMEDVGPVESTKRRAPRLVVAGLAGDSGKTLVSMLLLLAARQRGLAVRGFKKGPDYIDPSWLSWVSGHPTRSLDTFLMGFERAVASFGRHAVAERLNVIEGNRGLYDGSDAAGSHSTAELAKALQAPVLLVLNVRKVTRTAAAWLVGCQQLDPQVSIAGVVLNQVSGSRHERLLRDAIASTSEVPVLGVVPRIRDALLPGRHLGLVPPGEHPTTGGLLASLLDVAGAAFDWERLLTIAAGAPQLDVRRPGLGAAGRCPDGRGLTFGYVKDSAFSFYYPDNLDALEASGASLVPVSALSATGLPGGLDALYIGGGFPETHAAALAANVCFLQALRTAAGRGLPIYAECGGLILLSRSVIWNGQRHGLAGVFPFDVLMSAAPQGHGYVELAVDRPNPYFPAGLVLKGHEFHYSRILSEGPLPPTAGAVRRGTGCAGRRDGLVDNNVWASYTHLHALATPEWTTALVGVA